MGAYLVFQFSWWAYLLVKLNTELQRQHLPDARPLNRWSMMILGEGAVFLGLLMLGLWFVWQGIQKDQTQARHERNFLLAVTHELKTPIAAIRLAIDTLRRSEQPTPELRAELFDEAHAGTRRLERRIDDILQSTRLQRGEALDIAPLDVEEVVQEVIRRASIGPYAGRAVEVHHHGDPQGLVDGDERALGLAWGNILENAFKYSPSHEPVHIHIRPEPRRIRVSFDDGGEGIPSDKRREVVKKFRRLEDEIRRKSEGTGLGLYLADSIFRLHRGQLTLSHSKRGGTVVETMLPLS
jgi:signal transduction histidine kinase